MDESTPSPWHILVVDDDETVLAVTRLVFRRLRLLGRQLKLHCFSDTRSARAFLSERNDIAIGIIDVVMETTTDGLDLIRWIRDQPHLYATRLVVRTGEPGELPEAEVLERYEINDYWPKATLESRRLQTLVLGLLRSYRDIVALREERAASATSRAEAQRAQRKAADREEWLNVVTDALDAGALLCAGEEILFSNPTATQMLSLADTDGFHQLPDALKQARAGATGELTQTASDGSTVWLEYRTRAVHAGIRSGLLISLTDVTERKANERRRLHAERELLKGQHMEQIGLLAGGVAHDINNMMSVVEVNGGILLETVADPATREVVEDIVGAGQATAELVRQLLAYAGGQKTRLHTIDLDGEAVRAARLWRSEARSRHIQMHIEGTGQPLQIEADAGLLQQVVSNLISNALRHTPATGTVQVKLSRALLQESDLAAADLSAATAGEFAILSVLDSGCGLSPEVRSRMFQPFFTTHQAGRGLGLSAVQGIVQRLRGAIFAESSPSGGTCFRVALPLSSRDASHSDPPELVATDSQPPIDRQTRSSLRVLVVEDSVLVRRQICRVLTRAGMTALPASDLAEALTVAEQGVDAAVIDFFLEVETGDEVLQMLRTLYPRLPAVLCSGYVGADSERNVTQGFQAFIPKPFKPEKLVTTVRELTASDWEPA